MAAGYEFGVLGPLTVRQGRTVVPVTPGRQQALLTALVLQPGERASLDYLAEVLWDGEPPPSAVKSLQNYVKRLRGTLGQAVIVTDSGGYRIDAGPGQVDAGRLTAALAAGREAARAGEWAKAAEVLAGGLALIRGEPLAGIESGVLAAREVPRLAELRWQAAELLAEAELALGRRGEVIGRLRALTAEAPLRERLHALLMTALWLDGQQSAALAAYQDARDLLIAELGTGPGAELQAARRQVQAGAAPPASAAGQAAAASARRAPGSRTAGPGEAAVRYSLPPDTAAFTGRSAELAAITAAAAAPPGGQAAVVTIGGMPGAGKTALAVRAAHLLAGDFPDCQLFFSLHGHTPGRDPVTPQDALAGLLAATGLDPRHLPADLDGRAALWRDRAAGQRGLLVIDNAASSAQVSPLLPGTGQAGGGGWLVLVTSRRHLGDLPGPVLPVVAGALPPRQAAQMFTRLVPRTAADPERVAEITGLAGCLPLAISLLARVHRRHPSWTLADLAAETRAGMLALRAEDDSVAAAFGVSWRHLDPSLQRFFRLLALHPGSSADAFGAAALAGTSPAQAARLLDALHGEGLVTETAYRRYGMHDLLRRYGRDHGASSPAGAAGAALGRLADYYARASARARGLLAREGRPAAGPAAPAGAPALPALQDEGQALAWARAERAALLACLDDAARAGHDALLIALTAGVAELLRRDGPWADAAPRHLAAVAAARRLGDRAAQASALTDLGGSRRLTSDHQSAIRDLEEALGICRDLRDRPGQAGALSILGHVRRQTGDVPAAARDLEECLAICRDLGDRAGEAGALYGLGLARQATADHPAAARAYSQALAIYRDLGDRAGEGNALWGLGFVRRLTSDYPAAVRDLEQALALYLEVGYRLGEGNALAVLGQVRRVTGDCAAAAGDLGQALRLYRELGDRTGQGSALLGLGMVHRMTGDYPAAARDLERALALYRELGSRLGEASALLSLGTMRRLAGDLPAAARVLDQALGLYRELGDRGGEAEALSERGAVHQAGGEAALAQQCHRQALDLARAIGSAWDEASALAWLGRGALAAGRSADARSLLAQALEIFERLGAAEAGSVRADLGALAGTRPAG